MSLSANETQIVIAEYVTFLLVTVLFSVLSLETKDAMKSIIFKGLSFIIWFMVGLFNLVIAPVDFVTQVAPTVLFFGFGLIWLVLLFKAVTESMKLAYEKKYSVDPI